jgi:tetratricopeptide (TPR) repeat protein
VSLFDQLSPAAIRTGGNSELPGSSASQASATVQSNLKVARAVKMWENLSSSDLRAIIRRLREAIDLDCENASAFAWLSQILTADCILGAADGASALHTAAAALAKALEIEPGLAEAQCAHAWLQMLHGRNWQSARRLFEESKGRGPAGTTRLIGRAVLYIAEGSLTEASGLLLEASMQNPLSGLAPGLGAWTSFLDHRFETALRTVHHCRGNGHSGHLLNSIEALVHTQLPDPAMSIQQISALAAVSPEHPVVQGALGYTCGKIGEQERANAIYQALTGPDIQETGHHSYAVALVLIGLNRHREALQWLEQSYRQGSIWSLGFRCDPIVAALREDGIFQELMERTDYPSSGTVVQGG